MDYDLYIRLASYYTNPACVRLPKNKPRIFTRESINLFSDIDKFSYYPNYGDLWISKTEGMKIEYILPLNCFLYERSPRIYDRILLYKCKTSDKLSPLYKLTYGTDTFANHLVNIEHFLKQYKIELASDIKIQTSPMFYESLAFDYYGSNNKKRRFSLKEDV